MGTTDEVVRVALMLLKLWGSSLLVVDAKLDTAGFACVKVSNCTRLVKTEVESTWEAHPNGSLELVMLDITVSPFVISKAVEVLGVPGAVSVAPRSVVVEVIKKPYVVL